MRSTFVMAVPSVKYVLSSLACLLRQLISTTAQSDGLKKGSKTHQALYAVSRVAIPLVRSERIDAAAPILVPENSCP